MVLRSWPWPRFSLSTLHFLFFSLPLFGAVAFLLYPCYVLISMHLVTLQNFYLHFVRAVGSDSCTDWR